MKIAITGHRPAKLGNDYKLESLLVQEIKAKIIGIINNINETDNKVDLMISGMALGIDTLFAKIAIELNLPLLAAIPFKGQELNWPIHAQNLYHSILHTYSKCTTHIVSEGGYARFKMQKRNIWMVNELKPETHDTLIAVWDGSEGGTKNCVEYAASKTVPILRINPLDMTSITTYKPD